MLCCCLVNRFFFLILWPIVKLVLRFTYVERLLSHHEHPVLSVLPYILVHIKGRHRHVDPTGQKLHLHQDEKCVTVAFYIQCSVFG